MLGHVAGFIVNVLLAILVYLAVYVGCWNMRRFFDPRAARVDAVIAVVVCGSLIFFPWGYGQLYVLAICLGVLRGWHEPPPRVTLRS